jgi:rubrerythrin
VGMKVDFSGDELTISDFDELEAYRIARKIEADGIYYYSRMLEEMLKPQIVEVIELLLHEERKHLDLFDEKVEELSRKRPVADDEETLVDIVDSKVFDVLQDSEQVADILCTPQEAVRLGIEMEKRSIMFYNQIIKNTKDKTGKAALQNLIDEERTHLKKLEGLLRK